MKVLDVVLTADCVSSSKKDANMKASRNKRKSQELQKTDCK